jgi:hypothetical protein
VLEDVAASAVALLPAAASDDADATATALAPLSDPRPEVAGRAAWALGSRLDEGWAHAAVQAGAPHLFAD